MLLNASQRGTADVHSYLIVVILTLKRKWKQEKKNVKKKNKNKKMCHTFSEPLLTVAVDTVKWERSLPPWEKKLH